MRLYHGTSFENACKILSEEEWVYPVENFFKSHIKLHGWEQGKSIPIPPKEWCGIFFSTSINHAKSYAKQHEKPVVLFWDDETLETSAFEIVYTKPIPTSKVKAFLPPHELKMRFYGGIVNALYGKVRYRMISDIGINFGKSAKYVGERLKDAAEEIFEIQHLIHHEKQKQY